MKKTKKMTLLTAIAALGIAGAVSAANYLTNTNTAKEQVISVFNTNQSLLAPDTVKQMALDRVPGANFNNISEWDKDYEHGRPVYEGEIKYNGNEYEFEVDAVSGEFLEWNVEQDDDFQNWK